MFGSVLTAVCAGPIIPSVRILSCNIRYAAAPDGEDAWEHRRHWCADVIRAQSPQVICFQEMAAVQGAYLCDALPQFDHFATIDEPTGDSRPNAIFYERDRFERISAGGYWLSQTPHVPGSRSWDSACVRLANWIRLRDTSGGRDVEFRVINTHLDHVSQLARQNGARMIVEDARACPDDYPQLLTGDMNCDIRNPAIDAFMAGGFLDTYAAVHGTEYAGHTYHGFRGPDFESSVGKMDWVLARGPVDVLEAEVITDSRNGRYPSDHYFVSATVRI